MTTKMTITDRINAINFDNMTQADFDFLVDRALKSVKPASKGPRKPTKNQVANDGFKVDILNLLADTDGMTATQVGLAFGWSGSQKASALMNQMVADGKLVKVKDGKVTLFKVAD